VTRPILAYLDPGSSSMIVQMLLGGLAAAGVALKLYWRRFLKFLHIRKEDPEEGLNRPVQRTRGAEPAAAETTAASGTDAAGVTPGAERATVETTKR
jgi:hypothetical protein